MVPISLVGSGREIEGLFEEITRTVDVRRAVVVAGGMDWSYLVVNAAGFWCVGGCGRTQ